MAVKALAPIFGNTEATAPSLVYAADNGADVVNMSFGGFHESIVEADAIAYAHNLGVVLVAAAGNSASDTTLHYPATNPAVISVAASSLQDKPTFFSD